MARLNRLPEPAFKALLVRLDAATEAWVLNSSRRGNSVNHGQSRSSRPSGHGEIGVFGQDYLRRIPVVGNPKIARSINRNMCGHLYAAAHKMGLRILKRSGGQCFELLSDCHAWRHLWQGEVRQHVACHPGWRLPGPYCPLQAAQGGYVALHRPALGLPQQARDAFDVILLTPCARR